MALSLFGVVIITGSVLAAGRTSAVAPWVQIPHGLTWFVIAAGVWGGNQTLLRRSIASFLLIKGATLIIYMTIGPDPGLSWLQVATAAVWIGLGCGVWTAREWARRGCGMWGLILSGFDLYRFSFSLMTYAPRLSTSSRSIGVFELFSIALIGLPFIIGPCLFLAIYSLLPLTRQHFAEARNAMARACPVPS